MENAAKEKGGSRGDQLGKIAKIVAGDGDLSSLMRERAGAKGAQAFIELPRNCLAKLERLGRRVLDGQPYCSLEELTKSKTGDASVAVALGSLGAGDERQKNIVAAALTRYPGGGNAQMPAALDACRFYGIVDKKETGSVRNAEYMITNPDLASRLIPRG